MSLNATPIANRIQIAFFGTTNAGKSSLINAIAGQDVSVVSEKKGTTTDPVIKTMELGEMGPVVLIDTPGLDDDTDIGELRIKRANEMFNRTDIVVVVIDAEALAGAEFAHPDLNKKVSGFVSVKKKIAKDTAGMQDDHEANKQLECIRVFINKCEESKKPYVIAVNKSELFDDFMKGKVGFSAHDTSVLAVSAKEKRGLEELKAELIKIGLKHKKEKGNKLVSDLISRGDSVVLVIPIDESAPAGRLILPQQQVIRDILDAGGNAICIKDTELQDFFEKRVVERNNTGIHSGNIKIMPALVITDSQVFKKVSEIVPPEIPLTSFSILMARFKGTLSQQVNGARAIESLSDGDTVLIAEGCTHHKTCEDIGTVKLPNMLKKYTGKDINIETSSGHGYPEDLLKYKLILHCGGCMLGESEVKSRIQRALEQGIPVTNYGVAIAYMSGILERSIVPVLCNLPKER